MIGRLSGVNPYLQEAMGWLSDLFDSWGGSSTFWSGYRSNADQRELFDYCRRREPSITKFPAVPCPFPVATPGCSQHEYGFAVDASFFSDRGGVWTAYAQELARDYWGLHRIPGDTNHFQMYSSQQWLPWVKEIGNCRPEPRQAAIPFFPQRPPGRIDLICGAGTNATSVSCGPYGCVCRGGEYG